MAVDPTPENKGPHGLGDPEDRSLRIVEKEVLIPKLMREKAKKENCLPEVEEFSKCCKDNSLLMAYYCKEQNTRMQECQAKWYKNEDFQKECRELYLKDRRDFRLTGVPKKRRNIEHQAADPNN